MAWDKEPIRQYEREYHPCENGVHVFDPEAGQFGGATVKNFPNVSLELFAQLTSVDQSTSHDDWDLLCDLMIDGDIADNVSIRRQDLALIERAITPTLDVGE